MSQKELDQTDIAQQEKKTLQVIITSVKFIIPIALGVLLLTYFSNFNDGFGNQGDFGAFGDFIGGILNPILTFFTIVILVYSIRLQVKELELTRNELRETKGIHHDNLLLAQENLKSQEKQYALEVLTEKIKSKCDLVNEILSEVFTSHEYSTLVTEDGDEFGPGKSYYVKLPKTLGDLEVGVYELLDHFELSVQEAHFHELSRPIPKLVYTVSDLAECILHLDKLKVDRVLLNDDILRNTSRRIANKVILIRSLPAFQVKEDPNSPFGSRRMLLRLENVLERLDGLLDVDFERKANGY
ncbi:hypothetical protein L1286_05905 [Pseudoalteromonas sp. SMS1]|uniref:hypothetical protein n=1 Tax=Pseudoalteromonas sp. SMS1 TaxID=2908894 RepID=UPI001F1F0F1A|nr:hypothetical protein [Pseudoalteromonas sp. SMS1]MCF2856992.1 hypothetical protein [Pseudoalteromonas sp. SMS1]